MNHILNCKSRVKIGDKHGRYAVVGEPFKLPRGKRRRAMVVCECDCGTVAVVSVDNLTTGAAQSCGCGMREAAAAAHHKHGFASRNAIHPLYVVWQGIKSRCYYAKDKNYGLYGARGIAMCEEWREDAAAFIGWAMEHGWEKGLEVDRMDNDLGYSPGNCRIVTQRVNQQNKRSRNWR